MNFISTQYWECWVVQHCHNVYTGGGEAPSTNDGGQSIDTGRNGILGSVILSTTEISSVQS